MGLSKSIAMSSVWMAALVACGCEPVAAPTRARVEASAIDAAAVPTATVTATMTATATPTPTAMASIHDAAVDAPRPVRVLPALAPAHVARCGADVDCTLVVSTCCGPCGYFGADVARAVNAKLLEEIGNPFCAPTIVCPTCVSLPTPSLGARCVKSLCRVTDDGAPPPRSFGSGDLP